MKRTTPDLRRIPLRLGLLAMVRSHATEHGLALRSAIKELQAAASLLNPVDLVISKMPSTGNPLIPAYKTRRPDGGVAIEFRCPACGRVHSHGLPEIDDLPLQHRGSHCVFDFGKSRGYRLLIVGWKRGDELPVCSADEIDALNAVVAESGAG